MLVYIILILIVIFLLFLRVLYNMAFSHPKRKRPVAELIPNSRLYRDYKDSLKEGVTEMQTAPFEEITITSYDSLILHGRFYEKIQNAPIFLCFHGYHGVPEWDGYGAFQICKKYGYSALMVEMRAHGRNAGDITFGIKERYDVKAWVEYISARFGSDVPLILSGVSMGAASVLLATELCLGKNVKGIISDCAYSKQSVVIKSTIRDMKLPVSIFYPLVKLSALIYARFRLEKSCPLKAIESLSIPILLIHGTNDSIIPVAMCEELYAACAGTEYKALIPDADHANSALTDFQTYEQAVVMFLDKVLG